MLTYSRTTSAHITPLRGGTAPHRILVIDERWERIKDLLHHAMQLAGEERGRFLQEACCSDDSLRLEIESLLAADSAAPSHFLNLTTRGLALDSADDTSGELHPGFLFEERFNLVRKLGEGGMGQVWLADQIAPVRRQVALKLIRAGMYDSTVLQRFHSERQSLALMDHPCIAKVFDAGATAHGQPYFVMEYVPGLPITEYCDLHKMKVADRLELLIRSCEGVQHAHQKAIIHRDLKPANILVVEIDGTPMPRIIDFGLAKPTTPRVNDEAHYTQFGQFIGTPGYMSPEQTNPTLKDIDTRTDVYSLGVLLCVLLTGLQPFEDRRREHPPLYEWLRRLREEDPPALSSKLNADRDSAIMVAFARSTQPKQLARQLRGDLDWITMKALERERERRYAAPSELAADLRRHLNDEPVVARPANAAYQLRKFIRRHRIGAAVAAIVGLFSIVTSTAGLIAVRNQREAEIQKHAAQYQAKQALQAQSRLLTEVAAMRLADSDVAGAQGIMLDVLMNPKFSAERAPAAIGVFQDVRAADRLVAVLSGHGDRVFMAAYSPEGARIVTASADNTARLWDADAGAPLGVLRGHGDRVFTAAWSPDGLRIVTGSRDKTARIWDARTGALLMTLSGHGDRIDSAAYSPDGTRIVTASWDRIARIWDARTGARLTELRGHSDVLYSAAYSPDGSRIVTASQDKTARVWDARTGAELQTLAGHGDYVACAAYSPDGTRIVTASADRTARIWDARSGLPLTVLVGHGDVVYSAAYSPDGARIVTGAWDKTARIWDARTGAQLAVLPGHGATVASAAYSPDGTHIVTASQDKTARIWLARVGSQVEVLSGHGDVVFAAAYSPDGMHIVTASQDKSARIWDAATGSQRLVLTGHGGAVAGASYSPDGTRIVTASQDKTARIWDAATGAELAVLAGHLDRVYSAAYSPDGARIVTASRDKTARLWDAHSGAPLGTLSGHLDRVYSAEYSPDGTRIVTASRDKTARLWDARSGAQLSILSGHEDEVSSAAYSPDGQHIVTASFDDTARVWDAHSGRELRVLLGHGEHILSAAYSPDGNRIVTTSEDKLARIWDSHTGAELAALAGHGDAVSSAAYSPDGSHIVTASVDGTARVWDASVSTDIAGQIIWSAAADPDPLPDSDPLKTKSADTSTCDRAGAYYDPDRATGSMIAEVISADEPLSACAAEIKASGHTARSDYEMGRVLLARGSIDEGRQQLERAVARGYRAARVDLADSLIENSPSTADLQRAISLYQKAWEDGVSIAAYRLGHFYESQSTSSAASPAWQWYRKGADAGEPNALGRVTDRDENDALTEVDRPKRNARLLAAFKGYAAAAERARLEHWPDEAWRYWRHRRASLARVLALEGEMDEVAHAYGPIANR